MNAIKKNAGNFAAIIGLVVIAAIVGGYILDHQRLRFPFIDEKPFELKAAFSTAQAVTPGQGQTVRVSGVRVGDIGEVELVDGVAIVHMDIDREYDDLVRTNSTALLRPKTGLKDMFVELDPGDTSAPLAKEGWTMPISSTLPDVNPDEVFSALDADTRDYLKLLVGGAGKGLKDTGDDLREVFRRFEPTHRDLAAVTSKVAERRTNLRRLIHSLNDLSGELESKDTEISQLIDSSAAVFQAFASENQNVSATVRELPSALRETTSTLAKVEAFANELRPAADELRPVARALNEANPTLTTFAKAATPVLDEEIRPFVRVARPTVRDLEAPTKRLSATTPDLTRSFTVLNHLFDFVAFNPEGREGPEKATRQEGYLFWLAWVAHQANNLFSSSDANGTFRPVTLGGTCSTFQQIAANEGIAEFALGLTPILEGVGACG